MNIQKSERLSYQLMNRKDAQLLFNLDQDTEVMKYINGGKMSTMEEIHSVYIPRMESYTNEKEGWGLWKACIKDSGDFIGWILIRPMDFFSESPQFDNIELGWRFKRSYWGKGFATEAAMAIKQAIVDKKNARMLTAIALEDNQASINIMRKLGMEYVTKTLHKDPLGDMMAVFYQVEL